MNMKTNTIFGCLLLLAAVVCSCNQNSYSAKRKAEDKLIDDFIKRQGINIIYEEPDDDVWGEKDYLKVAGYDDLYFHLVTRGDTSYSAKAGDKILVRYTRYSLTAIADTSRYMNTSEQAYPTEFEYQIDYTSACIGWHEAVRLMKHSGAACKIICPSKQGFDTEKSTVTPYGYDMYIQIPRY